MDVIIRQPGSVTVDEVRDTTWHLLQFTAKTAEWSLLLSVGG